MTLTDIHNTQALLAAAFGVLLIFAMTLGGFGVYRRWPQGLKGRWLFSLALLALPWTGLAQYIAMRVTETELSLPLFLLTPGAWALWLLIYIAAHVYRAVDGPLVATR